jgi:AcrR family transcriptional regulator
MLVAMADSVVELGYAGTRVADVIAKAGVSRKTFYEHFRDLEDCFLASYDRGVGVLIDELAESMARSDVDWRDLLDQLLTTYLSVLASEPTFTQVALVEVLGAGHTARARYVEAVGRFHDLLLAVDGLACQQDKRKQPAGDVTISILAGGLNRLVMIEVLAGRGKNLMQLHDELLELGLSMLGGAA